MPLQKADQEVQTWNGRIFNYIHLYWFAKKIFFPESFVVTSFLEKTAHATDHRLLTEKKEKDRQIQLGRPCAQRAVQP